MEETKCYCGHTTYCDCGPETLEEVAERLYPNKSTKGWIDQYSAIQRIHFIEGAKWQQEQILDFLYSEITERRDYSASKMCEVITKFIENDL